MSTTVVCIYYVSILMGLPYIFSHQSNECINVAINQILCEILDFSQNLQFNCYISNFRGFLLFLKCPWYVFFMFCFTYEAFSN